MRGVTEAIILHQGHVGEKDVYLVLLSPRWGRLSAVAKGARRSKRRFVNVLEPYSLIRAHLRGGRATLPPFLDQADLLEPYELLRLDPRRYVMAAYFAELTESFFRPGTGQEAYPLLRRAFEELHRAGSSPLLKTLFELQLLQAAGFAPRLEHCVRCQKEPEAPFSFSLADGGVVCARCRREEDRPLSGAALAVLRHFGRLSWDVLPRVRPKEESLSEAGRILEIFLKRILDREISALRVLKEMF